MCSRKLDSKGSSRTHRPRKKVQKQSKATIVPAFDLLKLHQTKPFLKGGNVAWMPSHMTGRQTSKEVEQSRRWLIYTKEQKKEDDE